MSVLSVVADCCSTVSKHQKMQPICACQMTCVTALAAVALAFEDWLSIGVSVVPDQL